MNSRTTHLCQRHVEEYGPVCRDSCCCHEHSRRVMNELILSALLCLDDQHGLAAALRPFVHGHELRLFDDALLCDEDTIQCISLHRVYPLRTQSFVLHAEELVQVVVEHRCTSPCANPRSAFLLTGFCMHLNLYHPYVHLRLRTLPLAFLRISADLRFCAVSSFSTPTHGVVTQSRCARCAR